VSNELFPRTKLFEKESKIEVPGPKYGKGGTFEETRLDVRGGTRQAPDIDFDPARSIAPPLHNSEHVE
jgi:hypothetical protein